MQKGFTSLLIVIIILIIMLVGTLIYFKTDILQQLGLKNANLEETILTPEEVLLNSQNYSGKTISIKGVIRMVSCGSDKLDGLGIIGAGFQVKEGIICLNGLTEVYNATDKHQEVIVKGVYSDLAYANQPPNTLLGTLKIPPNCSQCLIVVSTIIPTLIPPPTIDTANWKTYTNSQKGISFKYPQGYSVREGDGVDKFIHLEPIENTTPSQDGPSHYFYMQAEVDKSTLDSRFVKSNQGQLTIYTTDQLPSQSGSLTKVFSTDGLKYASIALSPYNSHLLDGSQGTTEEQNTLKTRIALMDQILSTFKFTK